MFVLKAGNIDLASLLSPLFWTVTKQKQSLLSWLLQIICNKMILHERCTLACYLQKPHLNAEVKRMILINSFHIFVS